MAHDKKTQLVGLAGTYFAAAELSQQGHIATVTSRNAEGIDILASRVDGSKVVSIQVKASGALQRSRSSRSWLLGQKDEKRFSDSFFYVFVDLHPDGKHQYYIVPSEIVAKYIQENHQNWLKTPGRKGREHKDSPMRTYQIKEEEIAKKYQNNWTLLGL